MLPTTRVCQDGCKKTAKGVYKWSGDRYRCSRCRGTGQTRLSEAERKERAFDFLVLGPEQRVFVRAPVWDYDPDGDPKGRYRVELIDYDPRDGLLWAYFAKTPLEAVEAAMGAVCDVDPDRMPARWRVPDTLPSRTALVSVPLSARPTDA